MTDYERLQALARALAAASPDVSELFAWELGRAARREKVNGLGFGISLRVSHVTGQLEMRGGELDRYVAGEPPGQGYAEEVIPLPLD